MLHVYDLALVLGNGRDSGGVTLGDKAAKRVTSSRLRLLVFNHWIFLRRPRDYFLQKPDIFEEQTGHRLLCLCQQNLVFLTRPPGHFLLCLWRLNQILITARVVTTNLN